MVKSWMFVAVIAGLAACGGGGGGGSSPSGNTSGQPATVTGIAIEPPSATIAHGDPLILTARLRYSDGSTAAIPNPNIISWSSANNFIATVSRTTSGEGQVNSGFRGPTTITARYQGFEASASITITPVLARVVIDSDPSVMPPPPPGGSLSVAPPLTGQSVVSIPPEFQGGLFAFAQYSDGVVEHVTEGATWSVAHQAVATVSDVQGSKGVIDALRSGTTTISAVYSGITTNTQLQVQPVRLIGRSGIPFGPMSGLLPPMATIDGQGRATAAWSFQITGEVFSGGHDGTDWTGRVQINSAQSPIDQAILAGIASNSGGARLIVWYGNAGVYASYAAPGAAFGTVDTIPTNGARFDSIVATAVTDAGEAIVLWTDQGHNAYINRYSPAAGSWSQSSALGTTMQLGRASFNKNGDAVLAWRFQDPTTGDWTLRTAIYLNGSGPGTGLQPTQTLFGPTPLLSPYDLGLAINNARDAVVAWTDTASISSPPLLYAAQYSSALGWHTNRQLSLGPMIAAHNTTAAINEAGHIMVAWTASNYTLVNRFSPASGWQDAEQMTSTFSLGTAHVSALALDSNGNAICIFAHATTLTEPIFKFRRYVVGAGWDPLTAITEPGTVGNPGSVLRASYNANGDGILAWFEGSSIPNEFGGLYFVSYGFMKLAPRIRP